MTPQPGFERGAAYVDGRIVPIEQARIPILDWGFLHSDATYDVAHLWKGRFFRLDDHLDRFERGMRELRMRLPLDRTAIREVLFDCVHSAGLGDAYVEMICTRGVPPAGTRDPRECANAFYAFAIPFVWIASPEKQETGLDLAIVPTQRIPPASVDPRVKNYHWLDMVRGLFQAYDRGAETALLVDAQDNVIEGPGFNVFAVHGECLTTPASGVLEGITRRTVLEIAARLGLAVQCHTLPAARVRTAGEVFVTSTAGGIMPVTRIDGVVVGDGRPGPLTRWIRDHYWALHTDPTFSEPVWDR